MAAIRTWWGEVQRRLGIYPQAGTDTALCQGCAQPGVEVVTVTPAWGGLGGWGIWRAWHTPCYRPDARIQGVWWLPGPIDAAWDEIVPSLPAEPAGCCGCGGDRGPSRYAVWAPGSGPADAEAYCRACFIEHGPDGWTPGCTWADLDAGIVSVEDERIAVLIEYPIRRPFEPAGGAS